MKRTLIALCSPARPWSLSACSTRHASTPLPSPGSFPADRLGAPPIATGHGLDRAGRAAGAPGRRERGRREQRGQGEGTGFIVRSGRHRRDELPRRRGRLEGHRPHLGRRSPTATTARVIGGDVAGRSRGPADRRDRPAHGPARRLARTWSSGSRSSRSATRSASRAARPSPRASSPRSRGGSRSGPMRCTASAATGQRSLHARHPDRRGDQPRQLRRPARRPRRQRRRDQHGGHAPGRERRASRSRSTRSRPTIFQAAEQPRRSPSRSWGSASDDASDPSVRSSSSPCRSTRARSS